jgi:molybdate transport system regulatory protein
MSDDTASRQDDAPAPRLRLRLVFDGGTTLGPGKADLLELICETGSIAAAGRRMQMSYKRAWSLVEDLNGAFREPVVDSTRGGSGGGGARLTETGRAVLDHYRRLEAHSAVAGRDEIAAISAMLRDMSERK